MTTPALAQSFAPRALLAGLPVPLQPPHQIFSAKTARASSTRRPRGVTSALHGPRAPPAPACPALALPRPIASAPHAWLAKAFLPPTLALLARLCGPLAKRARTPMPTQHPPATCSAPTARPIHSQLDLAWTPAPRGARAQWVTACRALDPPPPTASARRASQACPIPTPPAALHAPP